VDTTGTVGPGICGDAHGAAGAGPLSTRVDLAQRMATRAHAHQVRQGSELPYIVHPARVVTTLRDVGVTDADILAAAWLHDVVEDTRQTLHDVRVCVGDRAARLVGLLTKVSPFDPTPYFGAIWADEDATAIKLATGSTT